MELFRKLPIPMGKYHVKIRGLVAIQANKSILNFKMADTNDIMQKQHFGAYKRMLVSEL